MWWVMSSPLTMCLLIYRTQKLLQATALFYWWQCRTKHICMLFQSNVTGHKPRAPCKLSHVSQPTHVGLLRSPMPLERRTLLMTGTTLPLVVLSAASTPDFVTSLLPRCHSMLCCAVLCCAVCPCGCSAKFYAWAYVCAWHRAGWPGESSPTPSLISWTTYLFAAAVPHSRREGVWVCRPAAAAAGAVTAVLRITAWLVLVPLCRIVAFESLHTSSGARADLIYDA